MAFRALFVFLSIAGAFGEDVASALASDDVCEGQDCSLELHQLRGMKVNYLEALEDASEEVEEEAVQVEQEEEAEAEVEGGGCTGAADMKTWKHGGITNDKSPACTHCVKSACRPKMKACSGLAVGGH
ncbi:hypothetical protein AK812_SmicGene21754 [Symbiodinium microadriaticum]|uniref:Uncharacterized protein n=1 Tax=Symbiodinium microadriaticum TaxID=2951 RepID=A0A1Q9DLN7_SYMMI|nr:hypothetical protein AK812_SmicGene21754 [Symbiodinium microadriaticum]